MRRSPALIIGMLGILKAGGAYLPLDPNYPPHRLAHMIVDARPPVLVTEAELLALLPSHKPPSEHADINWPMMAAVATLRRIKNRVQIDADAAAIAAHSTTAPEVATYPDNLAYLLYTSGSTGRPKGVMGTHRAIVNRLYWDVTEETSDEVYAQKTTPNFIDALWEIFMPLLRGQSAIVVPEDVVRDPERLIDLLSREGATRIVLVPSLLRAILDSPKDLTQRLHKLRHWACSGEALSAPLAAAFRNKLPNAQLFNIYGTSEFWDATWFAASGQNGSAGIPIGLPIANMRAHVLHGGHEPAPTNVAGELHIGGVGLARGYLGNPGLTAERFLPDPFGDGERIYRSGDLARRLPGGVLEYVGRKDRQVKLRGHRIELSEIEHALEGHPVVRNATVQLRDDLPGGEPGLVAYVAADASTGAEAALRAHLQVKLPSHMIPAHFILLAKLPLTPNGKIDRAALPSPQPKQEQSRKHVAPKSEAERMLAGIWSEILGIREIGIDDNFFERGGDSLMLVRVQGTIKERLHRDIPVTMLFRYPTIRALSSYLTEGQQSDRLVQSTSRGEARKKFLARRARH
jgi:amino acid adenylation domain-containing protein